MATTMSTNSTTTTLIDGKAPLRQSVAATSSQCVTLPSLPPPSLHHHQNRAWKATGYCRKLARNVAAMATGEASLRLPQLTYQNSLSQFKRRYIHPFLSYPFLSSPQWDKVEDKYAVSSLAVAGVVALWGSTGMISAIDRLPLIPGVLELVGIGYTGWFAYKNLVFKPDREALIEKIKCTYKEIIGSS
ncbi:hypothetical protein OSB04_031803 [Centaurea solstitialis]|uniref:Cyanobacterial aminoacyl-tRNA synthetase CAAD domain-containing protein n=1 Tax=Centaurea solstitialis TaxID=347529 RepID=A0AA38SA91_9ASTR|nr:hypothetical protein OSB04_031803 [Centaurea solstitialis]